MRKNGEEEEEPLWAPSTNEATTISLQFIRVAAAVFLLLRICNEGAVVMRRRRESLIIRTVLLVD